MTSSNGNIFRVTGPLCGEFTGPGEFPTQRPVTRSFDVFFDLRLNKRLSKQPWGWWFETPSWPLWRQCNGGRGVLISSIPKPSMSKFCFEQIHAVFFQEYGINRRLHTSTGHQPDHDPAWEGPCTQRYQGIGKHTDGSRIICVFFEFSLLLMISNEFVLISRFVFQMVDEISLFIVAVRGLKRNFNLHPGLAVKNQCWAL